MLRLAALAAKLKQPIPKVQSEILVRANGRLFMKWNDDYFAFKAAKDVIVPVELAQDYARVKCKSILPTPMSIRDAPVLDLTVDQDEKKRLVLTLLGHFNHGKTSLLDALINYTHNNAMSRSSISSPKRISSDNTLTLKPLDHQGKGKLISSDQHDLQMISDLVSAEKHGITQEVRSRHISISPKYELTLIDTPGQEIFYRMRNTGSEVSDGSLLLIAVDNEIQLQTKESIGLVESSNKPVIVCLNKVDLAGDPTSSSHSPSNGPVNYLELPKVKALVEECRDYIALEQAPIIPLSATAAINLDLLVQEIQSLFLQKFPEQSSTEASSLLRSGGRSRRIPRISRTINNSAISDNHIGSTSIMEENAIATDNNNTASSNKNNLLMLPKDEFTSLTGRGVVLNLVHEIGTPPSMHILLREGTIRVGDYLQAGGWMGRVKHLTIEDNLSLNLSPMTTTNESKNNKSKKNAKGTPLKEDAKSVSANKHRPNFKSHNSGNSHTSQFRSLDVAYPGMAVRIVPTYLEDCVDPRPVGERIHFFSPHVLEVQKIQVKQQQQQQHQQESVLSSIRDVEISSKSSDNDSRNRQKEGLLPNEKKKLDVISRDEAIRARDEYIMEDELELFAMTDTQVDRFRLLRLFSISRLSKQHFYVRAKLAAPVWVSAYDDAHSTTADDDDDDDDDDKETDQLEAELEETHNMEHSLGGEEVNSNHEEEGEEEEKPVIEVKHPTLLVVRMRSDLDMGTFLDRYYDYRTHCAATQRPAQFRVIQSGIGTISKVDVQVALAAGKDGLLVGYGVDVEAFAMKDIKENRVKLVIQDNMPELLQSIFGTYHSSDDVASTNNSGSNSDKKKKKKKKKKASVTTESTSGIVE